jgi:hypothetical protein
LDRPLMAPWSGFWGGKPGGDAYRGTPVVVKMENPNWSISEISSPEDDDEDILAAAAAGRRNKGGRTKNAKQIRWVLLLKAHRAAGCLASLASAAVALGGAARRRVAAGRTDAEAGVVAAAGESPVVRSRFYAFIKAFLVVSLLLLAVEVAAYFNGWDLAASALALPAIGLESLYASWLRFRATYVAPGIQFLTDACVVLFLIQSADRLIQCLGCFYIHIKRIKPKPRSLALPDAEDPDAGYYPMVLVQIPMCNEKEVGAVFLALNKQIWSPTFQSFDNWFAVGVCSGVSTINCGRVQP